MFGKDLDRRVQDAVAKYESLDVAAYQAQVRGGLMRQDGAALQYGNGATRSGQMWQHALTEARTYGAPPEFLIPFAVAYRNRVLRACESFDNYGL
jgi:hypothetical protein